jgi:hypothetical protein
MSTTQAKTWQDTLAPRWERVRAGCSQRGWDKSASPTIASLARKHSTAWYAMHSVDRVDQFIRFDADSLFNRLRGFGRVRCERLVDVLERALAESTDVDPIESAEKGQQNGLNYEPFMETWDIPADYPLALIPLSNRLLNFSKSQQIGTLKKLLQFWEVVGYNGFITHRNMGRHTADSVEVLANAIATGNVQEARKWLPLNETANGLSLRAAVGIMVAKRTANERILITRRLVDGMTLEESAASHDLSRERIRQLENLFLHDLRAALDWFKRDHAAMLELWTESGEWRSFITPQSSAEDTALVIAGINAVFAETPQGVARRLASESYIQTWIDCLCAESNLHLDGVDLQAFMDAHLEDSRHDEFITAVSLNSNLVIDHIKGVVRTSAPCIRDTILALLQREEDPVPLTWLERMVTSLPNNEEGTADFIRRNRYRWSHQGLLDLSKVLWDQ